MPTRVIAQVVALAVALTGSSALEARYGAIGASLSSLPNEEVSIFKLASEEGSGTGNSGESVVTQPSSDGLQPPPSGFQPPPEGFQQPPTNGFQGPGGLQGPGGGFSGEREEGQFGPPGGDAERPEFEPPHEECKKQIRQAALQMGKVLTGIDKKLKQLARQGVTPSAELNELIAQLKDLVERAKNVEGCDDAMEVGQEIGPLMGEVQEKLHDLEQCAFLPRMKKEIIRQHNFIKRDWARVQGRVKRVKNVDLSELLNEGGVFYAKLEEMKTQALALIDEIKTSGECERAEELFDIGEEARDIEMELRENINTLMALVDTRRQFNVLKRERKGFDRTAKQLEREDIDASELKACLGEFDSALETIQGVLGERPLDPENLRDAFDAAEDARNDCREIADNLQGTHAFEAPDVFGEIKTPSFLPSELFGPAAQ